MIGFKRWNIGMVPGNTRVVPSQNYINVDFYF